MAKNRKTSRASRMASARAVEAKDTKKPTITLAIIALLIKLDSPGPVFYISKQLFLT